ncbi:uncharacterized protein LOC111039142 [Myzus persicae]|uniref:uncharacterized protein LOC111039142 n=1 Tax=Myzus persicae TaxID=13164 RepID=UPI000B932419|nr:uncharacterized protein LOC111039142 [Myzus persicae]
MAGYDDHLIDEMDTLALSVNDELVVDDNIRAQLRKIEKDYESIFSWDIQGSIGVNKNQMSSVIDKVREKTQLSIVMDAKGDGFNLTRFYLQLIVSYELYIRKSYKESYLEIERVIKFLETCAFNEHKQYADAYHHIARATYACIALMLPIDSEKLLKDIKDKNDFNEAEKSAVCAVKAKIFMEYSSKLNEIALICADEARTLHSTEPEWTFIWLKAKGRVRRFNEPYKMPGDDEIKAADLLCSKRTSPFFLIKSSQLYKEAGFINKLKNNYKESDKFFKLSSDMAKISVELAGDDVNHLNILLLTCIECPDECFSKSMIDNLVIKLSNVNNSWVDQVLGLYYLKNKKDYVKAKMYLSRGMAFGHFGSALQLIKVECLLQSVKQFPFVDTLKGMYDNFQNQNRRLVIIVQILMYYTLVENNPKQILWYLKLYLDQDIEDIYKKRTLIFARPLFNADRYFKPNEFMNVLFGNIKELMNNNDWDINEKNTFDGLSKILKLSIDDDDFNDKSWRKQKVNLSENKPNGSLQKKNESWRKKKDSRHE